MRKCAIPTGLLLAFFLAAGLMIGCGGGGGESGGGTTGPPAGTTITIETNAAWVATQKGSGTWQVLQLSGSPPYVLTFDVGSTDGPYGVALVNPYREEVIVYQLTRREVWSIKEIFESSNPADLVTVSGSVTFSPDGNQVSIFVDSSSGSLTSQGAYVVNSVKKGIWDVVAVETPNTGDPSVLIHRDVTVDSNITGQDFDFSSVGVIPLVPHVFQVTGGTNGAGECFGVTSNGTSFLNCNYDSQTGNWTWYSASSGMVSGDVYVFAGAELDSNNNDLKMLLESRDATEVQADVTLDLSQISQLSGVTLSSPTVPPVFDGLSYTPAGQYPLLAFDIGLIQGQLEWEVKVSKGWLDAFSTTSYEIPDFYGLSGWDPNAWGLKYGQDIEYEVSVLMSNKSPQDIVNVEPYTIPGIIFQSSSQHGTFTPVPPSQTAVTVTTDADWVAYQVENGPWVKLVGTSPYQFDAGAADAAYGVAFHFSGENRTEIMHFTRDEVWGITEMAGGSTSLFTVSGTVSNLNPGTQAQIFIQGSSVVTTGTYTVSNVGQGYRDIFAMEFDSISDIPLRYMIDRDVLVDQDLTGKDFDFTGASGFLSQKQVTVSGGAGAVNLYTKNETTVYLGDSTYGGWFPLDSTDTVAGDRYQFQAVDNSQNPAVAYIEVTDATATPKNYSVDLSQINHLNTVSFSDAVHPTISGLTYTPAFGQPLLAYHVEWDQSSSGVTWGLTISDAWMSHFSANSYAVPDFTGISGWNTGWDLTAGSVVGWEAWAVSGTVPSLNDIMNSTIDFSTYPGVQIYIAIENGTFTP